MNGKKVIAALAFQGSYQTADFGLQSDRNGGTDIIYTAGSLAPPDLTPPTLTSHDVAPPPFVDADRPRFISQDLPASAWHSMGFGPEGPSLILLWEMIQHRSF